MAIKTPFDDHDLLIRLDTKVDGLTEEIRQYGSNSNDQIKDHEVRLRNLETSEEVNKGKQANSELTWAKLIATATFLAALVGALWWVKG